MAELAANELTRPTDRPDDEERALAQAAAAGDRRAFAALYDRYLDPVYRYLYFRLRSVEDAEEMTSEVFHRALAAMPRYEARRPFLAFLYTIARNLLADRWRKGIRPEASYEDALLHPSAEPGPEELALASADAREVRSAIAHLTPMQQEVVILRFIDGRTTKEISQLMGRPEGSIRGAQMRALAALRLALRGRA